MRIYLLKIVLILCLPLLLTACGKEVTTSYFCMRTDGSGSAGLVIGDSTASLEYEDFKFESKDGVYRSYETKSGSSIEFNQATAQLRYFPNSEKEKTRYYDCHLQNVNK